MVTCECGATVRTLRGLPAHRRGQAHVVRTECARLEAMGLVGIDGGYRSSLAGNDYVEGPLVYVPGGFKHGKVNKSQVIRGIYGIYVAAPLAEITRWDLPPPLVARVFECCGHLHERALAETVAAARAAYALDAEHAEIVAFFEAAMLAVFSDDDDEKGETAP